MKKAFLDTTILANALLKRNEQGRNARAALSRYAESMLPVFAIKEFKAGALRNFVWFYNKVVTVSRWSDAIESIEKVAAYQGYKARTALTALREFESCIGKHLPSELAAKYPHFNQDEAMRAEAEIWLKTKIMLAWRKRRKLTTRVVEELSCYREVAPRLKSNRTIDDKPVTCGVLDCCLRSNFVSRKDDLASLIEAHNHLPPNRETTKRRQALRHLHRVGKRNLAEEECRVLGDAVFVLQCPSDAVILTTNIRDFSPLAAAIGRSVEAP